MTQSADAIAQQQVYLALAPLFLEAANGNHDDARAAASATVAGHRPQTAEEFLLVAQMVAYGLAGLDSARRSAENPDLTVNAHLRLRGNAVSMQRASQQCRRALDQRRKQNAAPSAERQPAVQPHDMFTEADLQAAIQHANTVLHEARAITQPQPAMNRAARRAAEFQARRAQRAAGAQLHAAV